MKNTLLAGIALILIGAAVLGYDPITATADRTHTISFPPILGWLLVGGGICALGFALLSKKN
jgi:hypothetical protein